MSFGANLDDDPPAALPGAYVYELVSLCSRWSVGAAELLDGTGLTLEVLKDPGTRLPLPVCAALVERARALTHEPALAFAMGLHMRLSWHGFLGFAAMTASTVREALELAEQFSLTRTSAFGLSTYVEGGRASLVLEERVPCWVARAHGLAHDSARVPLGPLREFAVIMLLVGIGQIARDITGQMLEGHAECAFPEPRYAAELFARVGDERGVMRFGQPAHRLVFDAAILDMKLVAADPAAMELARAQCERELAAQAEGGSFVGKVRAAIAHGKSGFRSLDEVARRLHVSTRTLKRRLAARGSSFSRVLDEVRRQCALLLLADRRLSLTDVADRLGYSDVANFTRAFRRWTGQTPASYRDGQ